MTPNPVMDIVKLLELKVNVHGQLHLDAEYTKLLISHLKYVYRYCDEQQENVKELTSLLKPILLKEVPNEKAL